MVKARNNVKEKLMSVDIFINYAVILGPHFRIFWSHTS